MIPLNVNDGENLFQSIDILTHSSEWIQPALNQAEGRDVYLVANGNSTSYDVYLLEPIQNLDEIGFAFNNKITGVLPIPGHAKTSQQIKQYVAGAWLDAAKTESSSLELIARNNSNEKASALYVRSN